MTKFNILFQVKIKIKKKDRISKILYFRQKLFLYCMLQNENLSRNNVATFNISILYTLQNLDKIKI